MISRRVFLQGMSLMAISALFPTIGRSSVDISTIEFDSNIYNNNQAQTIIIYLYGGASELGGNLTNIEEIQTKSQNKYYLNDLTKTENNFWEQAGGKEMEEMLSAGDMNIFRTCYRKANTTKSHGECTAENQRGRMNKLEPDAGAGIIATLSDILYKKGVVTSDSKLPFLTMEGESNFFAIGDLNLPSFLRPSALNENLSNPYERRKIYETYQRDEWNSDPRPKDSDLSIKFDEMAKEINGESKIQDAFDKRATLDNFITNIGSKELPEGISYDNNTFAKKLKVAVTVLANNPDTKIISIGSGGLGGWDDHSDAVRNYSNRMKRLMSAIKDAISHAKALNKDNINIIVFAEFGRNVNLNDAEGWDHGNNQNVYIFGGKRYFNHLGVVGETELEPMGSNHRLYLKPKDNSYWFEPYSIAATIYKMYGIKNPEVLTGGYDAIDAGLFKV